MQRRLSQLLINLLTINIYCICIDPRAICVPALRQCKDFQCSSAFEGKSMKFKISARNSTFRCQRNKFHWNFAQSFENMSSDLLDLNSFHCSAWIYQCMLKAFSLPISQLNIIIIFVMQTAVAFSFGIVNISGINCDNHCLRFCAC